jgi:5-formyltetrahydrofolate cyclo-ligase
MSDIERNMLRRAVLAERDRLSVDERLRRSSMITSRLLRMPELIPAETIFVYMHFRSEVLTMELITQLLARAKNVTIPYVLADTSRMLAIRITDPEHQVIPGYYGIPEPLPPLLKHAACQPDTIDAVIVPGSVFDRGGRRLGYGGGFYDRFLALEAPQAVRISPAYELQLVERVPVEPHDQRMDFVVTEKTIYTCRRNRNA